MIIYNPLDGDALTSMVPSNARHCFLMTRLGPKVPNPVEDIRKSVTACCTKNDYDVIDASSRVTGRDFLLKIWKLIASAPLSIGICHEEIPDVSQANIYYELGVAQALGKETVLIKSPKSKVPSDFVRTEYIEFDNNFDANFQAYMDSLVDQADHYELVADQLDRNPILALDYLKRAFLITGREDLRSKAQDLIGEAELENRAKNSVEQLVRAF